MNEDLRQILGEMTLEQKAALLCGAGTFESAAIESLRIPSLVFSDGSQGVRRQMNRKDHLGLLPSIPATCFPAASSLACSWDRRLCFQVGEAMGKEARKAGVDVLLAPALNLIRHPLGGRNFEYFSEDPCLGGELSAALVEGIQKSVSACPKHFLLNSQETNRMSVDERASEKTIMELYLPAFERMIKKARPDWIMSSYNKVNGIYASENSHLLKGLLREKCQFDGAVVTDWGGGNRIEKAVAAGGTLEMPSTNGASAKELVFAVKRGILDEDDLDQAVLRMLAAIQKAVLRKEKPVEDFIFQMHHKLALAAAQKSAVLLKNENHLLPLKPGCRVCFIGDFESGFPTQGSGSASVNEAVRENFRRLAKAYGGRGVSFVRGYRLRQTKPSPALENAALRAAEKADVLVFLGALPSCDNTEGLDRVDRDLPKNQSSLIRRLSKLKKPMVLADAVSGAIELGDEKAFSAILYLGLDGEAAREAMLSILYGKHNPSGHLAFAMAARFDEHGLESPYPGLGPQSLHSEGGEVGYRYFLKNHIPVRYPFGYGLSYTEFELRDAFFDNHGVRFFVQNTGERTGTALLQMYRALRGEDGDNSLEELCGFERIRLRPGEIGEGFIPFDEYTFRRYLPQQHRYAILKEEALITLRWNARDVCWRGTWFVSGGEDLSPESAPVMPVYYRESRWPLDLETPLSQFKDAPNRSAAAMIRKLEKIRDASIKRRNPDLVLSALLDMPLKSDCKLYPGFMNFAKANALVEEMRIERQESAAGVLRLFKILLSPPSSFKEENYLEKEEEEGILKEEGFKKIGS